MSELQTIPSREQIENLQREIAALPKDQLQAASDAMQTEHYFHGGMYARKLSRPAGTLIVGKVHKQDHYFLCAKGEIIAWTEGGMKHLYAGDIVQSKPGTKRVTLAATDAIGITFHVTDKTDLDEIEKDLIEPDELALFDSSNKLKVLEIKGV